MLTGIGMLIFGTNVFLSLLDLLIQKSFRAIFLLDILWLWIECDNLFADNCHIRRVQDVFLTKTIVFLFIFRPILTT